MVDVVLMIWWLQFHDMRVSDRSVVCLVVAGDGACSDS